MRRYDEPIDVRAEVIETAAGEALGPVQFVWKRRLWRVLEVETRWSETADWWSDPGADLLAESEVWRVVAASGSAAVPGVYDLACGRDAEGAPAWQLRAVVD